MTRSDLCFRVLPDNLVPAMGDRTHIRVPVSIALPANHRSIFMPSPIPVHAVPGNTAQ
jgi:hypothetical protein